MMFGGSKWRGNLNGEDNPMGGGFSGGMGAMPNAPSGGLGAAPAWATGPYGGFGGSTGAPHVSYGQDNNAIVKKEMEQYGWNGSWDTMPRNPDGSPKVTGGFASTMPVNPNAGGNRKMPGLGDMWGGGGSVPDGWNSPPGTMSPAVMRQAGPDEYQQYLQSRAGQPGKLGNGRGLGLSSYPQFQPGRNYAGGTPGFYGKPNLMGNPQGGAPAWTQGNMEKPMTPEEMRQQDQWFRQQRTDQWRAARAINPIPMSGGKPIENAPGVLESLNDPYWRPQAPNRNQSPSSWGGAPQRQFMQPRRNPWGFRNQRNLSNMWSMY